MELPGHGDAPATVEVELTGHGDVPAAVEVELTGHGDAPATVRTGRADCDETAMRLR